jgi:SHS2 domain-containing protein
MSTGVSVASGYSAQWLAAFRTNCHRQSGSVRLRSILGYAAAIKSLVVTCLPPTAINSLRIRQLNYDGFRRPAGIRPERREPMPSHKFNVGEVVIFKPGVSRNAPGGVFEVVKVLPGNDEPEYRIKSADEEYQRVARESELTRISLGSTLGSFCGARNMPAENAGYDLLEHPADVKLCARGRTLEELFANAAAGMMAYLFGAEIANARGELSERIEVNAPDREALLVDFLSELLYRATSQYRAYVGVCVHEISDRKIVVTAAVVSARARDDIKAVTHHQLAIRERSGGWEATVVFDI